MASDAYKITLRGDQLRRVIKILEYMKARHEARVTSKDTWVIDDHAHALAISGLDEIISEIVNQTGITT